MVAVLLFEESLINTVKKLSTSASKQITKEVGDVDMPAYVSEINYKPIGKPNRNTSGYLSKNA